ncbi:MAG: hypothetical protein PHT40_00660 [Patescibacteria group bacterium]|nr:hypothetical protein [Patescibacteria group bacterium]
MEKHLNKLFWIFVIMAAFALVCRSKPARSQSASNSAAALEKTRQAIAVLATLDRDKSITGLSEKYFLWEARVRLELINVSAGDLRELVSDIGAVASWTKSPHGGKIADLVLAEMAKRAKKMSKNEVYQYFVKDNNVAWKLAYTGAGNLMEVWDKAGVTEYPV